MWGFVLFKWWSFRSVAQHCRKFVVLRVAVLRCLSETHCDVVLHSSLMLPWQPYTAVTCNAPRNLLKSCRPAASFWMQQVGNFDSSDFKAVIKKKHAVTPVGHYGRLWRFFDLKHSRLSGCFLRQLPALWLNRTCFWFHLPLIIYSPDILHSRKSTNETSVPKLVNNKHVGGGERG